MSETTTIKEEDGMPAYNFMARFAADVETGAKPCTIRRQRRTPTKAGDQLQLYTGMRTRACRKLRQVPCLRVTPIIVRTDGISLDGRELTVAQQERLAQIDGRCDLATFRGLFAGMYGLPTTDTVLIEWEDVQAQILGEVTV